LDKESLFYSLTNDGDVDLFRRCHVESLTVIRKMTKGEDAAVSVI